MRSLTVLTLLITSCCLSLAQSDSVYAGFEFSPLSKEKSILTLTNAQKQKFVYKSYSGRFTVQLPRDKYYFIYFSRNRIAVDDSVDLTDTIYKSSGVCYRRFYTTNVTDEKGRKNLSYVDSNFGLWRIHVDYDVSYSMAGDSLDVKTNILNSSVNWMGYCCIDPGRKKTNNDDSVRKDMQKILSAVQRIAQKAATPDSSANIDHYLFNIRLKNQKFSSASVQLRYDKIGACSNIYSLFTSVLDEKYDGMPLDLNGSQEFGHGRVYSIGDYSLEIMEGMAAKTEMQSKVTGCINQNRQIKVPPSDHYFITILYYRGTSF